MKLLERKTECGSWTVGTDLTLGVMRNGKSTWSWEGDGAVRAGTWTLPSTAPSRGLGVDRRSESVCPSQSWWIRLGYSDCTLQLKNASEVFEHPCQRKEREKWAFTSGVLSILSSVSKNTFEENANHVHLANKWCVEGQGTETTPIKKKGKWTHPNFSPNYVFLPLLLTLTVNSTAQSEVEKSWGWERTIFSPLPLRAQHNATIKSRFSYVFLIEVNNA